MSAVLFPVGLTQRGWGRPCSHACSVETGWVGPSFPLWEKGYVDFLPWFLCVWKHMCRYARIKLLLHTWVTLASVVGRFFCRFKGAVFSPLPGEVIGVWRCAKSMGYMYLFVHCEVLSFSEAIPPFVFWWLKVFTSRVVNLALLGWSAPLIDCWIVFVFSKGSILCSVCASELAYGHGDSLDEFRLLFWNKLVQCDLEPETRVVMLAECWRWPL